MRATFTLSDEQFAANDRSGVMVGLPLVVQLDAGLLSMGHEAGDSWFERSAPGRQLLKQISLERYAFSGRLVELDRWRSDNDLFCQALLDCGLPVRLDVAEPGAAHRSHEAPYGLRVGDWLLGIASLQGFLAIDPGTALWQPVEGTIIDIQRLCLTPTDPAFGTLRWLHGLPRRSYAPDQVFITVDASPPLALG